MSTGMSLLQTLGVHISLHAYYVSIHATFQLLVLVGLARRRVGRRFVQQDGSPKTWPMFSGRECGIGSKGRAHHELVSLSRRLLLTGASDVVDQAGTAILEVAACRATTIPKARRDAPGGQLRWEAAENTSGAAGLYNLVYSKPQSHDAPQTREEAEREAERQAEMRPTS